MEQKQIKQRSNSLFKALKNRLEMCVSLDKNEIIKIVNNMPWRKKASDSDLVKIVYGAAEKLMEENIAKFDIDKFILKSLVHDDNVYEPVFKR